MKKFSEWMALHEQNVHCRQCGLDFQLPNWLDSPKFFCPKCKATILNGKTTAVAPTKFQPEIKSKEPEWGTGLMNHYLGRGNW